MKILYSRYHALRTLFYAGVTASTLVACGGGSDTTYETTETRSQITSSADNEDVLAGRRVLKKGEQATEPAPAPVTSTMAAYERTFLGAKRTYNFDGSSPFVNPTIGQSNMEEMFYNAQFRAYDQITNSGDSPWITKFNDGGTMVTRYQVFPTDAQIWSWRTQTSSFPFEMYKQYSWDLEFKLDPSWNLNIGPTGDGLFWQAKGAAKAGQFSNASMSLGLQNDNLYFSILYPNSAMNATTWPTSLTWSNSDYVTNNFPTKKLVAGRYYKVRMEFFADDRPENFGGQGYMNIWLDDQLWIQHRGPNLQPDFAREPRWDFGWYNWGGQPTSARTVYYKTARVSAK